MTEESRWGYGENSGLQECENDGMFDEKGEDLAGSSLREAIIPSFPSVESKRESARKPLSAKDLWEFRYAIEGLE